MITEGILTLFFGLVSVIMNLVPSIAYQAISTEGVLHLIQTGLMFFPVSLWVEVFVVVALWKGVSLVWAMVEWVYKKIPGVS